jgi:hypothetical protein
MTVKQLKRLVKFYRDEVLAFNHDERCTRDCGCQELDEEMYARIKKQMGEDLGQVAREVCYP